MENQSNGWKTLPMRFLAAFHCNEYPKPKSEPGEAAPRPQHWYLQPHLVLDLRGHKFCQRAPAERRIHRDGAARGARQAQSHRGERRARVSSPPVAALGAGVLGCICLFLQGEVLNIVQGVGDCLSSSGFWRYPAFSSCSLLCLCSHSHVWGTDICYNCSCWCSSIKLKHLNPLCSIHF